MKFLFHGQDIKGLAKNQDAEWPYVRAEEAPLVNMRLRAVLLPQKRTRSKIKYLIAPSKRLF